MRQIRNGLALGDGSQKDEAIQRAPPAAEQPAEFVAAKGGIAGSPVDFERDELSRLQRADPEFADIIIARSIFLEVEHAAVISPDHRQVTEDKVFRKVRDALDGKSLKEKSKRAEVAVQAMVNYSYVAELLFRKVLNPVDNSMVDRMVIPAGGLRAFMFNGRRYKLTLRRALLLVYHDSESMGAHASVKDTTAKLQKVVWWPTLERDVIHWVSHCSVCCLVKPRPGITTDQRMELRDRPFWVIFIDASVLST